MIVYIDLEEHELLSQHCELRTDALARTLRLKYRLEDIAHDLCYIVHYNHVTPAMLHDLHARAVFVSGNAVDWEYWSQEELDGLQAVFREAAWPILAFCGGFQRLAQAYGGEFGRMGPLPGGTPDPFPDGPHPGTRVEYGYLPVHVLEPHALFEGVGSNPTVFQYHYWEIKSLPAGFRVLAESDICAIQAIAHDGLPLYGTQFHPEQYDDAHPDGRRIVENFLRLANIVPGSLM